MLTVLVDYESGNLHSAQKAFERMAAEVDGGAILVTNRAEDIRRADRIVLPGDGAFPACKRALDSVSGMTEALNEAVKRDAKPFLGICVGMQMLATTGHEYEPTAGLGWIDGDVLRIDPQARDLKVPHMGWNDLIMDRPHPVMAGISTGDHAYFVHSYRFQPAHQADLIAHVDYGGPVTAIVARDTVIGTQFHPEKSQSAGLRLIGNFLRWKP